MKRFFSVFFLTFIIPFSSLAFEKPSATEAKPAVTVELPGILGGIDFSVQIPWNKNVFLSQNTFCYNHDFAAVSCALAQAAYTDVEKNKKNFLKDFYIALGFNENSIKFFYDVDYSDLYGNDQSAFSLAKLNVGEKNVVTIAIRGTPTGAEEWISNTNIANSVFDEKGNKIADFPEEHEGFAIAVKQILEQLDLYICEHNLSFDDTIFWITGHSRGAAESNLLAVKLAEERNVPSKNIFAYTFASPNTTRAKDYADEKYGYIWNIVNEEDIVPTVPFESGEWQYHKYGKVLAFKNYFTARDFKKFVEKDLPAMSKAYEKYFGRRYYAFKSGNYIPYIVSEMLQAINKNPESYYNSLVALHNPLAKILSKSFDDDSTDLPPSKPTLAQKLITIANPNLIPKAENAANDMHSDVTYLSWLLTQSEKELYDATNSYILRFKGKAEVCVRDENDNELAKVVNGAPEIKLDGSAIKILKGLSGTVYIGIQGNLNLVVEITKDSMLPTKTAVELETFSPAGSSLGVTRFENIRPSLLNGYELYLTKNKSLAGEDFAKTKGRRATSRAWQNAEAQLSVRPIQLFDSNSFLSTGLQIGTPRAYFFAEVGTNLSRSFTTEMAGTGFVLQAPLISALNAGIMGEWKWIFDLTDDFDKVSQVPFTAFVLSFQPRWHIQFLAMAGVDFSIDGFNNGAFSSSLRRTNRYFSAINFSSTLSAYPVFRIGIKL